MTADHHPEELIDRARQGLLDPDQRSRLDRHLAICPACAGHLAQGPGFEQELAPQPRDEMVARRAVEAALGRLQRSSLAGRSRAWPGWLRLAAAGVLLASGVTATAAIIGRRMSSPAPAQPPAAPLRPVEPPAASRDGLGRAKPDLDPEEAERPRALPPRSPSLRPAVTAATLFERAGKLRREGRADAAIAAYRHLQETFPDARESQLSFALAGQLLLERGRPDEAVAQFDRHSKIGGDVGEEALAGRAAALEQLHRTADAIAAWRRLLEGHPGSVYAARARARLAQLDQRR